MRSVDDGTVETDTYSYPTNNNRLASIDQNGSFTRMMTYDNAGNTLVDTRADGVFTYTYNAANRMGSVTETGSITVYSEYTYNAQGQQVIRTLYGGASPVEIHSVHDLDGNRIAEYEYDSTTSTSTLLREYIWLQGSPIAVIENGTIHYIRTDHIGRPVFATDATGTQAWEATYLPFGGIHTSTGANSDLRFPGQWFQTESALHQNWMRDYDPTTGRYIQGDPLGLVDGASVYGYARGNPGRFVDPKGEQGRGIVLGGGPGSGVGGLGGGGKSYGEKLGGSLGAGIDSLWDALTDDMSDAFNCGCTNSDQIYHRLPFNPLELSLVKASGQLWGRKPRTGFGGGWPQVKAFKGLAPFGSFGYSFCTPIPPSRERNFMGVRGVTWNDNVPGIIQIDTDTVAIPVTVIE